MANHKHGQRRPAGQNGAHHGGYLLSEHLTLSRQWRALFLCITLWCTETMAGTRHDATTTWYTLRTAHFILHFHHGLDGAAQDAARLAEQTHERLVTLFGWEPAQPTEVVLSAEVEIANGFSQPLPRNRLTLRITDPDEIESDAGVWLESLIIHEYTHTLHLDMASGAPLNLRALFGRHPLLFPDQFQPAWLIEGIATFVETDSVRGVGRGQSSYFDMLMRSEVIHGIKPLRQINQTIRSWPAGTAHYLYGVYFYKFIAAQYGEQRLWQWLKRYRNNLIPFRINSTAEDEFGKDLPALWDEFSIWLNERYASQVREVEARGLREGEVISHHGYDTHGSVAIANGTIFYVRSDGRSPPAVMRLQPGDTTPRRLCEVNMEARIDAHPWAGLLVAQPENVRNAGLVYDLFQCDERAGRLRRITQGQHFRYGAWAPDGNRIAALKASYGKQSIVVLNSSGTLIDVVRTATGNERFGQIAWLPDGRSLVVPMRSEGGNWDLYRIDLAGKLPVQLTFDETIELHPRVSPDGSAVLYAADYDGIYNIARLDLKNHRRQLLTNVIGGAFYPSLVNDRSLVFLHYTPKGYDVAKLDFAVPLDEIESNDITSSTPVEAASKKEGVFPIEPYRPQPWLMPSWWSPLVAWDRDWRTLGFETSSSDALERHQYTLSMSYDQNFDVFMGGIDYLYDRYSPLFELHTSRGFSLYRINETVAFVRGTDYISVGMTMPFLYQREHWASFVGIAGTREFDQYVAPGIFRVPDLTDYLFGIAFNYDSTRVYPLSVSRSDGRQTLVVWESSDIPCSDYGGRVFSLDWREFWALGKEHVAALRFFQGVGGDESRRFQLGGNDAAGAGFITDRVGGTNPLNRRSLSLRGYPEGLTVLRGARAQIVSAEWRFPIARIERGMMAPPVGLDQISGAVFVDAGGIARQGWSPEEFFTGAGVELYADSRFFYSLPVRIRLGAARGFDRRGESQVYVNIGSAF